MGNILEAMGLEEGSKTLDTPVVVEDTGGEEDEELSREHGEQVQETLRLLANCLGS